MLDYLPLWLATLIREICTISFNLFKLMIPIIIIVKIIEELGGIELIGQFLGPLMNLVGLPDSMGLIWATTMITNIYGGMLIFMTTAGQEQLTVAQLTVLGSMMLIAHALPIEVRIAQQAGVRVLFTLLLRIGGALLMGFLLNQLYTAGHYLNTVKPPMWQPEVIPDPSLMTWSWLQIKALGQVFLIISVLVIFLKLLKLSGIEKIIAFLLKPLLKVLGLSEKTTTFTMIGITLGLTYGGGLLIIEAKKGDISKEEVFGAVSLLALCHSLIEDTLLILLMGAHLSGILYFRLLFSLILIAVLIRAVRLLRNL